MEMEFTCKAFDDLTPAELYAMLKLRGDVFIVEQDCVYPDCDGIDPACLHLFCHDQSGDFVAGARIAPPGVIYPGFSSIGRVVVLPAFRGTGLGKRLMQEAIRECTTRYPETDIKIMAQTYLKKFYMELGFNPTDEAFLEDEIPHIIMYLEARSAS